MSQLSPPEHEHGEAVTVAAQWLANERTPPRPIIPALRQRFGLSALEATEAAAMADTYRRAGN
ncbi:hypothetical protein KYK30_32030 [Shinella yambaruensis]|uniref:hypothetical protein n=1 Tax=Shinella yambaruensis TaxID=415996 RepID=UPI001FD31716|nr:hypothetical protein [Shinella yambaruensis]MCJ8030069.1 hypothetical protein [Shinella yambaruensis]MCU7984356.1 hypothetical protein [Shinella yambaruensis]